MELCAAAEELRDGAVCYAEELHDGAVCCTEELHDGWRLKDVGIVDSLVDDVELGTAAGRERSMVDLGLPTLPPLCFTVYFLVLLLCSVFQFTKQ